MKGGDGDVWWWWEPSGSICVCIRLQVPFGYEFVWLRIPVKTG